jgi:hypothetical protein
MELRNTVLLARDLLYDPTPYCLGSLALRVTGSGETGRFPCDGIRGLSFVPVYIQ